MSISQTINPDSLKISPEQVKNIYIGLKQGEAYKTKFQECLKSVNDLNGVINDMNYDLQASADQINSLNILIEDSYTKLSQKQSEIAVLQAKKTPWYRHPVTAGVFGLILGILIAK